MCRKTAFFVISILILAAAIVAVDARNAASKVPGGLHDLSEWGDSAFSYSTQQVCLFCHTPHHAATASGGANTFLWNRALPTRTFTPYLSSTLDAYTSGSWSGPGVVSLLCLSCHDGIGAMNVLLNFGSGLSPVGLYNETKFGDFSLSDPSVGPLNIGGGQTGQEATTGGDLQDDHPIGFVYEDAQAADTTGLKDYASLPQAIKNRMNLTSSGTNHRVECSTCHDPHRTNTRAVRNKFLVIDNADSALCTGCHNK